MNCVVIDIRGNRKKILEKFLITLYILNLVDLIFTQFLLISAQGLFKESNIFMLPTIGGVKAYFIKVVLVALILLYWRWRSEKSTIIGMDKSIFIGKTIIGIYSIINIVHLINFIIYIYLSKNI